jgi:hypothetical protein
VANFVVLTRQMPVLSEEVMIFVVRVAYVVSEIENETSQIRFKTLGYVRSYSATFGVTRLCSETLDYVRRHSATFGGTRLCSGAIAGCCHI